MMVDVFVVVLAAVLNVLWGVANVKVAKAAWNWWKDLAGGANQHAKHCRNGYGFNKMDGETGRRSETFGGGKGEKTNEINRT